MGTDQKSNRSASPICLLSIFCKHSEDLATHKHSRNPRSFDNMAPKGISMAGDEHKFDFPSLILDHKPYSKRMITLVDLDVDVYGLDEIKKSKLPICAVVSPNGC